MNILYLLTVYNFISHFIYIIYKYLHQILLRINLPINVNIINVCENTESLKLKSMDENECQSWNVLKKIQI